MLIFENIQTESDACSILINYLIRSLGSTDADAMRGLSGSLTATAVSSGIISSINNDCCIEVADTIVSIKAKSPFIDLGTLTLDTKTNHISGDITFNDDTYHLYSTLSQNTVDEITDAIKYFINVLRETSTNKELCQKLLDHQLVDIYCEVLSMTIFRFLLLNGQSNISDEQKLAIERKLTRGHNHLIILTLYKRMKSVAVDESTVRPVHVAAEATDSDSLA